MTIVLLSGLGPAFYNEDVLAGTLFDRDAAARLSAEQYHGLSLDQLVFRSNSGEQFSLLRPLPHRPGQRAGSATALVNRPAPHLTTWTLESILADAGLAYEVLDLSTVWRGEPGPNLDPDIVLLSTTFIWHHSFLRTAIEWINKYFHDAELILGGQYSNLKFIPIMKAHCNVRCIVRGDGEVALTLVIRALRARRDLRGIPNLIYRLPGDGSIVESSVEYVNLDEYPSPVLAGDHPIVPYESMRGCPFSCRFCSFPHASPKWRYKSAEKIRDDWERYAETNGTLHVRAYDSTFATPPSRLRALLDLLPDIDVGWEAFARANAIKSSDTIDRLLEAHCRMLTFGFESMSPNTLDLMHKQVRANDNHKTFELLRSRQLAYRASFMVGYPGETLADYALTAEFLVSDYEGHFLLNVFSLMDETMPVWEDAEKLGLTIVNPLSPDDGWSHDGMDLETARRLMRETLHAVRWRNDHAVHLLWQQQYERPLMPERTMRENMRVEKLIERLGMASTSAAVGMQLTELISSLLNELALLGVHVAPQEVA